MVMNEPTMLGPRLTPPHGGLLRLQQSVQGQARLHFRIRTWIAAGVTASVVVLSLIFVVPGALQKQRMDVAMRQALAATPKTHFENGAYQVLPSNNPNVQILLVGNLPQQPATNASSDGSF
jgi:hypothetical protein